MRKVLITNRRVLNLLDQKSAISRRQKEISDEMIKLEAEFNTNLSKYQRIDEKARPLIRKITDKLDFTEYEDISRVHQDEKDMSWSIEIADRLEEFKEAWLTRGNK